MERASERASEEVRLGWAKNGEKWEGVSGGEGAFVCSFVPFAACTFGNACYAGNRNHLEVVRKTNVPNDPDICVRT